MNDDFIAIYSLYQEDIFRFCFWKSHDREIGQDLMQETFLRYWHCLEDKKKILNTRAFLYRIARNLIIDRFRRKKEESLDQLLEAGFEPSEDPWHHTYSHLDAERPLQKLSAMPNPYKQVLQQRFLHGLSPSEIAKVTGESANTVSVRIFRGLKDLRLSLATA